MERSRVTAQRFGVAGALANVGAIFGLHVLLSWVVVGAVALHLLGTIYHHFIKRDIVLRRMLPSMLGGLSAADHATGHKTGRKVVRMSKNKFRR